MKSPSSFLVVLLILLTLSSFASSRHMSSPRLDEIEHEAKSVRKEASRKPELDMEERTAVRPQRGPDTLQVAGSSLPDCSNACGSCRPCRLVMVSFVCASLAEAETCPMAYKCMCRNKSFPVP